MSSKIKRELMEKLDASYRVVQQSSAGISAVKVAEKLKVHRTTAHSYLNTLEHMERVYSQHGLWYDNLSNQKAETKLDQHARLESEIEKAKEDLIHGKLFEAHTRLALATNSISPEKRSPELQACISGINEEFKEAEDFWRKHNMQGSFSEKKVKERIINRLIPKLIEELERYVNLSARLKRSRANLSS